MITVKLKELRLSVLYIEWNSIRQGGPAHGIVTQTVDKTLSGGGGVGWGGDPGVVGVIVLRGQRHGGWEI